MNKVRHNGHILHGSTHTKYPCTFQFHEPSTHKPVWVGWAITLQPEDSNWRSHQTYKMSLWVFGSAINKPSRPRTCPVPAHPSIPMGSALSQVLQSLKKSSQALNLGDNTFLVFQPLVCEALLRRQWVNSYAWCPQVFTIPSPGIFPRNTFSMRPPLTTLF